MRAVRRPRGGPAAGHAGAARQVSLQQSGLWSTHSLSVKRRLDSLEGRDAECYETRRVCELQYKMKKKHCICVCGGFTRSANALATALCHLKLVLFNADQVLPRQRRFIYRVSALAFWTTYLFLSIARRALRALSHRKFTLHFLTKISTRQALSASPSRGRRQAPALIFYFSHPHLPLLVT